MSTERNDLILDLAAEGFWDWDLKTDRAYLSPRYCELVGYTPEETVFDSHFFRAIIHPDDRSRVFNILDEHLQGKRDSSVIEYRMISRDGTTRWIQGRVKTVGFDDPGVPARMAGTIIDITEHREIEKKLRQSEEKFSIAFRASPDSININRLNDGMYLEINDGFTAITGYTSRDVIGKTSLELNIWVDPRDRTCLVDELRERGVVNNLEAQFRRKDGSILTGFMSARMIEIEGQPCILSVTRDISERKRVEDEIRRDKSLLRCIIDSVSDLIFVKDTKGVYQVCNKASEEFIGLPECEQIGKTDFDFFSRDVAEVIRECDQQIMDSGKELCIEEWVTSRDGNIRLLNTVKTPFYSLDGKLQGVVGISHDITERKREEAAISNSNKLLQAIINTAPMRVFWKDTELRYLGCNLAFAKDAGCACPEDLIGKNDYQLGWKGQAELYRADDRLVIGSGNSKLSYDEPQTTPAGNQIWLRTSKVPLRNEADETIGVLGIYEDITERKQAEKELHKKNSEIEQFTYTVSHDLRSPLVTVKTFLGYLESDMAVSDQERIAQDLQFIHSAADKMKLLLDELLEMSRIDRIASPPVKVSLKEVLTEALDTLAGVISDRKVVIRLPGTDLMLFGDRPRLCQIWQNLVENAIKYSHDESIPRIELGVRQIGGETVFFVKDYGIGIDSQYHSKIFGIFEKLDPKSPGAGLGLSMIQKIVEKNGGRVWVESGGSGNGACFFFTLPHAVVNN